MAFPPLIRHLMAAGTVIFCAYALFVPFTVPDGGERTLLIGGSNAVLLFVICIPLLFPGRRGGYFHPLVVSSGLAMLKFFFFKQQMLTYGLQRHMALPNLSQTELADLYIYVNLVVSVSWLAKYAGFYLAPRFGVPKIDMRLKARPELDTILMLAFGVCILSLLAYMQLSGGILGHLKNITRGWANKEFVDEVSGVGHFLLLINLAPYVVMVWIVQKPKSVWTPPIWALTAMGLVMAWMANGRRSAAVFAAISLFIAWSIRRKKMPVWLAIALALAGFFAVGVLGLYRTANWGMADVNFEFLMGESVQSLAERSYEEISGRVTDSSAVYPILERVGDDVPFMYGASYLEYVYRFIPRAAWPDKPRGLGPRCAEIFYGRVNSGGIPPGAVGEAYWNGHIIGVILVFFIFGMFLRWLGALFTRYSMYTFAIVIYVITLVKLEPSMLLFTKWLYVLVPIMFVMWLGGLVSFGRPISRQRGFRPPQSYY